MCGECQGRSASLLTIQADGDYAAAKQLDQAHIPVDIRFEQGLDVLGLKKP